MTGLIHTYKTKTPLLQENVYIVTFRINVFGSRVLIIVLLVHRIAINMRFIYEIEICT